MMRQLAVICKINLSTSSPLSRYDYRDGEVPVIGNGRLPRGYHDVANIPASTILISRTGCYGNVSRYDEPVFVTNEVYYLTDISPTVDEDYLYVYIKHIAGFKIQRRHTKDNKGLSIDRLARFAVYVPSPAIQRKIASAYLTFEKNGELPAFDKTMTKTLGKIQDALCSTKPKDVKRRWLSTARTVLTNVLAMILIVIACVFLFPEHPLTKTFLNETGLKDQLMVAKHRVMPLYLPAQRFGNKTCRAIIYGS